MTRLTSLAAVVGCAVAAGCGGVRPLPPERRPVVSVAPFTASASATAYQASAAGLADAFASALLATGRVALAEGGDASARFRVTGSVLSAAVEQSSNDALLASRTSRVATLRAEARLVEAATGLTVASARAEGRGKSVLNKAMFVSSGGLRTDDALFADAAREVAARLAEEIAGAIPAAQPVRPAGASRTPAGARVNVAVADLDAQNVSPGDAAVIADWLRGDLVKAGALAVVERTNMQKILAEHAFQQTGCTSQECAVKLGRILNVRRIVVGSFGKFLGSYTVSVRVIDVESGEVVLADEAKGRSDDDLRPAVASLGGRLSDRVR